MAVAYDPKTGLALPDQGTTPWTAPALSNWTALANMASMSNVWWVDKSYTLGNLFSHAGVRPPSCRFYDTIQGAINAAQGSVGYSDNVSIMIAPDLYEENLTITGTVALYGLTGCTFYGGLGSAQYPRIMGLASSQNPVITITPASGVTRSVGFYNLNFENQYNGNTSGLGIISKAYLLDVTRQATFNASPIWVSFKGCGIRMQTWGYMNEWLYGFKLDGYTYTHFLDCDIASMSYAGGDPDGAGALPAGVGGIMYSFYDIGPNTAGKSSILKFRRCQIARADTGAGAAASRTFYIDQGVTGRAHRCDFGDPAGGTPLVQYGGAFTNLIDGLLAPTSAGAPNSYGNLFSIASSML